MPAVTNTGSKRGKDWNSVTLNFSNPFTDRNGDVVSYSVIVADAGRENPELREDIKYNWFQAHAQNPFPPYAAIYKCPTLFEQESRCSDHSQYRRRRSAQRDYVVITVGEDTCDDTNSKDYCNGPLKPDSSYWVFIRGYNEEDEFTDATKVKINTGKSHIKMRVIIYC